MADLALRDLERIAATSMVASDRVRLMLAAERCGQEVTWRGGSAFEIRPAGAPVNGYFTGATKQIRDVAALNTELKLGLSNDAIANAWQRIPPWPHKPLTALVLVWYQDTIQQTFESGWKAIQTVHLNHWRSDWFYSVPSYMRLLPGIAHPGTGLRWEVIDLAANWDKQRGIAPRYVCSPQTSPHAGILAAAALHPTWVTSMDGINVPYVWAAGYQLALGSAWSAVIWVGFDRHERNVQLGEEDFDKPFRLRAVPSLLGE